MGAGDAAESERVKWRPYGFQVVFDLFVSRGPHVVLAGGKVFLDRGVERMGGHLASLHLVRLRVLPEADPIENLFGFAADMLEIDFGDVAESNAAMFLANLVLGNKGAVFAFGAGADTKTKPVHLVIELDMLRLAGGHLETRYACLGEFHGLCPLWEEPGKIKTVFPRLPVSISDFDRHRI